MRNTKQTLIIVLIAGIFLISGCRKLNNEKQLQTQRSYRVEVLNKREIQVIDGDTIKYRGKTIRLLGIDAPEKESPFFTKGASQQPWAGKAKQFIEDAIFDAGTIKLIQARSKDRYNRYLGYILVDDKNLNAEIARAGLAYTYYLDRYGKQGITKYWQQVKDASEGVVPEFSSPEQWRKENRRN